MTKHTLFRVGDTVALKSRGALAKWDRDHGVNTPAGFGEVLSAHRTTVEVYWPAMCDTLHYRPHEIKLVRRPIDDEDGGTMLVELASKFPPGILVDSLSPLVEGYMVAMAKHVYVKDLDGLRIRLQQVQTCAVACGGKLKSRQVIAMIVEQYAREERNAKV